MTNFALDTNSSQGDIISSLNYALVNLSGGNVLTVNPNGSVTYTGGGAYSYLYQYLWVAFANNSTGTSGFSFSPTNTNYYGVRSNASATPSSTPADYSWTQVAGGFGTTNFLWYITYGGGKINFYVGPTAPDSQYRKVEDGVAIDLYLITASAGNVTVTGTSAGVIPQIINFPQNSDGSYTPDVQVMSASFNTAQSISYANISVSIDSGANVLLTPTFVDPTVTVTTINSSETLLSLIFTQTSGASVTGTIMVQQVPYVTQTGSNVTIHAGNTTANITTGISSLNLLTYTLSNISPLTPLANTGSWNFATSSGTPPLDPNWYVMPSTITPDTRSNFTNFANVINNYTFTTIYVNTLSSGSSTPPISAPGSRNGRYTTFNITGNTAYVDLLLVGGGGQGNVEQTPGYLNVSGGNGGNVVVYSNVALAPGPYSVYMGSQAPTVLLSGNVFVGGESVIYSAQWGGVTGIPTRSAGGGNGNAAPGQTFIAGNYGPYNGGPGVADPWNQISWIGSVQANGVAYFGGGGGAGTQSTSNYAGVGGIGGGGYGGYPLHFGGNGFIGSGGGAGGGGGNPLTSSTGYGGSGVLVIRQLNPYANGPITTWTLTQPSITATQQVYSSTALATTANVNQTANVTTLAWSSPIVSGSIAPPGLIISYPDGQYVIDNNGVFTPSPVGGVVTLTANVQATRANTILAAVDRITSYFTANSGFTITSNASTAFNASALQFLDPVTTQFNLYQTVNYGDIGGNVSGFISEALLQTTTGNTGAAGFIPLAYIVANVDPTTANTSVLSAMYAAPRTNVVPPIGVGVPAVSNDTAQFFYPNVSAYGGGVTAVKLYNGTAWQNVNAQVISGATIFTGTITASQINVNEVYALTIASTSAKGLVGNTSSPGFWLAADTGDAHFAGNLTIGANASIGSNLQVGTNANIGNNLRVGDSLIVGLTATIGQGATIGDTLTVGNSAYVGNYLQVGTNAQIGANLSVGNNATIGANLTVGANLTLGDNLYVGNNTVIGDNLSVGKNASINQGLSIGINAAIGANLNVGANLIVGSNATIGTNLTVGNSAIIGSNLTVTTNANIGNNLRVGNNAVIGGNLTVAGIIFQGNLQANVVTANTIVPGSITNAQISSNTITNVQIGYNTITANNIQVGALTNVWTSTFGTTTPFRIDSGGYYSVIQAGSGNVNFGTAPSGTTTPILLAGSSMGTITITTYDIGNWTMALRWKIEGGNVNYATESITLNGNNTSASYGATLPAIPITGSISGIGGVWLNGLTPQMYIGLISLTGNILTVTYTNSGSTISTTSLYR